MTRPSATSSASFVRCSWARWIGLRVWKPATSRQPRRAISARSARGVRRCCANGRSAGSGTTLTGPATSQRRPLQQIGHAGMRGIVGARRPRAPRRRDRARRSPRSRSCPRARPSRRGARRRRRARGARGVSSVTARVKGSGHTVPSARRRSLEHALVVGRAEEPGERAGRAGGDELEVGQLAGVEGELGQRSGAGPERLDSSAGTKRSTSVPPCGATRSSVRMAVVWRRRQGSTSFSSSFVFVQ